MTGGIEEQVKHNKVNTPKTCKVTSDKQISGKNNFNKIIKDENQVDLNLVDRGINNSDSKVMTKLNESSIVNNVNLGLLNPGKMMIVPIQL